MSWVRGIVPGIVAITTSAALGACVDATIGETPFGPDAGESSGGGARDDTTPEPDGGAPSAPDVEPDAGGGFGGGGGGGGGLDDPDAGVDPDAAPAPDAEVDIDAAVDAAPDDPEPEPEPFTLTHSASLDVVELNSVACVQQDDQGNTTGFLENRYHRVFDLSDSRFDLDDEVFVDQVDVGVEVANAQAIELNLYRLDGELRFENLTPVAEFSSVDIPAVDETSILEVTFPPQQMLRGDVLVVEFVARDRFFIGSNQQGESDPSYIAADECGITEPTPFAQIFSGHPIHVVMQVHGESIAAASGSTLAMQPTAQVTPVASARSD